MIDLQYMLEFYFGKSIFQNTCEVQLSKLQYQYTSVNKWTQQNHCGIQGLNNEFILAER